VSWTRSSAARTLRRRFCRINHYDFDGHRSIAGQVSRSPGSLSLADFRRCLNEDTIEPVYGGAVAVREGRRVRLSELKNE